MKNIQCLPTCQKSFYTRLGLLVLVSLFMSISTYAATYYWVGGNGTWDNSTNTHWASSSGGAGGAGVPGSSDIVYFDANSGSPVVTVGATITVSSIYYSSTTVQFVGTVATTQTTTSSGIVSGSATVTLSASNSSIAANQEVAITSGTGTIPQYATVNAYSSGATTFTLTNNATASNSAASTLTFYSAAPTITTTNCYFYNNNTVILGGPFTVSTSLDFSNSTGSGSKMYLPNTQMVTVGSLVGMSSTNVFSGSANPELKFNSSTGTSYFDPSAPNFFGLYIGTSSVTATLGSSVGTSRLSYAASSKFVLTNSGTILSHTFGGTSTYNGLGIDASAAGTGVQFTGTSALPTNYFANTTLGTLTMNKGSGYVTLAQALTVTNLNLTNGTLINSSTYNITVANSGTITRNASTAVLTYPPVYGGTSGNTVNVTYASTSTGGSELLGTTGSIGTLTVNNTFTATLNSSGITSTSITAAGVGYNTAPSVTFNTPTNGVAATGTAIIANGTVTGIYITNAGLGYTATPTVTIAAPSPLTWAISTAYAVGNVVSDVNGIYYCATAGTSASSGTGPSGTGSAITDGGAKWNYIGSATSTATASATYSSATSLSVANIVIGSGTSGILQFPNINNALTLNVSGNITVNAGGQFNCGTQTNSVTHLLNVGGNISNSGTFNLYTATGNVDATLNGSGTQTLTGTFTFNNLTISNASATLATNALITVKATLTVGAAFTQPVSTWISTLNLTINSPFTIAATTSSPATSTYSSSGSNTNNASFYMNTSAGTLANNSSITINGYFRSNMGGSTNPFSGSGTYSVGSYGVYEQFNSGGFIPSATWATTSTLYVTGTIGVAPTINAPTSNTFGNIIWNTTSMTVTNSYIFPSTNTNTTLTINNLVVLSTGASSNLTLLETGTSGTTLNIASIQVGSTASGYSFNGSTINTSGIAKLSLYYNTSPAAPTIAVNGNILISGYSSGGTATLNTLNGCTLTTTGNFTVGSSNSTFTYNGSTSGYIDLTFNGSGTSASPQTLTAASQTLHLLTINNSTFVTTSSAITTTASTTISSGATFAVGATFTANAAVSVSGTFQLNSSGWATGSGIWSYSSGTLAFNSSSAYTVNNSDVYWPTSSSPTNITILQGGLTLNSASRIVSGLFQTAAGVTLTSCSLTLNGTTQINTGGYFNNAPIYGTSSLLKYNTGGTFARSTEWSNPASSSVGAGTPASVQISGSTTLNYPNGAAASPAATLTGYLTVDAGSAFYMDYGSPSTSTGALTVSGNVTINGSISLGNQIGGDLYVGGNLTNNGTFTHNSRAVFINGSSNSTAQTISGTFNGSGTTNCIPYFKIATTGTAGVTLSSPVVVTNTLTLTSGILTTTSVNLLSVTNTSNSAVTATTSFSASTFINGPLAWTLPNGTSSSSYVFPVGSGSSYYPITLANPVTSTSGTVATAQVTLSNCGGSVDGTLTAISGSEYWSLSSSVGNITGGNVSITRTGVSLGSYNYIGASSSLAGTYTSIGGTASSPSINTSSSISAISAGNSYYYVMAFYSTTPAITGTTGGASASSGYFGTTITINGANFASGATVSFNGGSAISTTFINSSSIQVVVPLSATTGNITVTSGGQTTSGYSFTILGYTSVGSGDWSSTTASSPWPSGYVPASGSNVVINSAVTVNASVSNAPASVTVNSSSSLTFGASGSLTASSTLTNSGSIIMTSGGTLTLSSGAAFANSNIFTYGTGTLVFSGTGSITGTTPSFYNLTVGGAVTLSGAPTIYGTLQFNSGASLSTVPVYTSGSTLSYNETVTVGTEWGSGSTLGSGVPQNVTIVSGTVTTPGTSRNIIGNLNINGGTLALGANLQLNGNWSNSSTFTPSTYSVTFGGTTSTITNSGGTETFYGLAISNSTSVSLASNVNVTNLSLTAGTFDVTTSNYSVTVSGNFAKTSGTFTARSGTVTFNGAGIMIVSGSNSFYNLQDITGGGTLEFTAGTTQTIGGTLTLTGTSGSLVNVASTASSIATINPSASSVSYCSFTYITNTGSTITANYSSNGGNNTNITFSGIKWVGGTAGNWETGTNWSTGTVPATNDNVIFDNSVSGNTSPTVTLYSSPTVNSITYTNSNVTYAIGTAFNISGCTTTTSSANVTLGSSSSLVFATETVTSGTGATLQSSTTVSSVQSSTAITLSKTVTTGGTSQLTFTPVGTLTATSMTLSGSTVSIAGPTNIYGTLSLTGGSIFKLNVSTSGSTIVLGNGGTFSLTTDASDYISGNGNGYPNLQFNTTSSLTPYFDPTTSNIQLFGLTLNKANETVTLGSSLSTTRLTISASGTDLVVGTNNTFTINNNGSSSFTTTGGTIDASASGCSVVFNTTNATVLSTAGYIFAAGKTINSFTFNESGYVFNVPAMASGSFTVNNLILQSGVINNSTNNITIASGGSITRNASSAYLTAAPILSGTTSVTIGATSTAGNELQNNGGAGSIGALTVSSGTYTLNATGLSGYILSSAGFGYSSTALPTVVIGTQWAATTAYTLNQQVAYGSNLYTVSTAGTSNSIPPTNTSGASTGTGTVIFTYAGNAALATITSVSTTTGGVNTITISNPGSGYTSTPTVTISAPATPSWAASTSYSLNQVVYNGADVYICTTAGTSASSGGPTGTGTGISDGSVSWKYQGLYSAVATATATVPSIASSNTLNIGSMNISGTVYYPNVGTSLTVNVTGAVTVNTGGSFKAYTQSTPVIHSLNIGGGISNSGTFTMAGSSTTAATNVTLNGAGNISGILTFNGLTISNSSINLASGTNISINSSINVGANFTQPVNTTINTPSLTITGSGTKFTIAGTSQTSDSLASSVNAYFVLTASAGASTASIATGDSLIVDGWFLNHMGVSNGSFTLTGTGGVRVDNYGVFQDDYTGALIPAAYWATNSTLYITGIAGTAPSFGTPFNNTFGNIIWNCPLQTINSAYILPIATFPSGTTSMTMNNLVVLNTGTSSAATYLKLCNSNYNTPSVPTVNITNIQVGSSSSGYSFNNTTYYSNSGGRAMLTLYYNSTPSGTPNIVVSGNVNVQGYSTNSDTAFLNTGDGCSLSVKGNFTVNSAYSVFNSTGFTQGYADVILNGSGTSGSPQMISLPAPSTASSSTTFHNFTLSNSTYATLNGTSNAAITVTGTTTINSGSTLALGGAFTSATTSVSGTLQLNSGGSVINNPTYTSTATLAYNTTATVGNEWGTGSTLGTAAAENVSILSGTVTTGSTSLYALGNLSIASGTTLALGGGLQINGNWNNSGTFTPATNIVTFGGSTSATITNGTGTETFYGLTISNSGGVALSSNVTVSNTLTMASGILTTTGYTLNLASTASTSGGSNSSYISGPATYTLPSSSSATATYTLPLGASSTYMGFALVNPVTGTGTVSVTVQAYGSGSSGSVDGSLVSISGNYWSFSTSGNFTSASSVELIGSSIISNSSVVAGSTGGNYTNLGGTYTSPYVVSTSGITGSYQDFAVGVIPAFSLGTIVPTTISGISGQGNATGYYGQTITINGYFGGGSNTVSIGGTDITSSCTIGTTTITLALPTTVSTGTLQVTEGSSSLTNSFTVLGYISTNSSDWATTATWLGGSVPTTGSTVTINNAVTVNDGTATSTPPSSVTILSGESLTFGSSGSLTVTSALGNAGTISMTSGGMLNVGGSFTNTSTFTAGSGTVAFNGASSQTIPPLNYNILSVTNTAATVTAGGTITVGNNLSIASGATLAASSYTINVAGSFSNAGTFSGNTGTVTFNGIGNNSVSGSGTTNFNAVTVANNSSSSGTNTLSIGANVTCAGLLTVGNSSYSGSLTVSNGNTLTLNGGMTLSYSSSYVGNLVTSTSLSSGSATNGGSSNGTVVFGAGNYTFNAGSTITNNGYLQNSAASAIVPTTITMGSYSIYEHSLDGGTVPTATWASTSTLYFTGMVSTRPTIPASNFGNVVWNCVGQGSNSGPQLNTSIQGNLVVLSSGSGGNFHVTNTSTSGLTYTIGGFIQVGGTYGGLTQGSNATLNVFSNGTSTSNPTIANTGGITVGGTSSYTASIASTSVCTLTTAGNFTINTYGTATMTNISPVIFNGSATQTISTGLTFNTLSIYNSSVVLPSVLTASTIAIGDGTHSMSLTQPAATIVNATSAFNVSLNATYTIAAGTGASISSGTNNAVLNFNSANGTITNNGTIAINGWFTNGNQNTSTATTLTGSGAWTIGGQGVYQHNTINGQIPSMTWVSGSTLYYTGTHGAGTLASSGLNQSFRKVIYNCPTNSSSANYFNPTSIQDTLYVVNTGTSTPRTFQIENNGASTTIGTLIVGTGTSSYYFNGGVITSNPVVVSLGTVTAPTISVIGNVLLQGNNSTNTATLTSSSGSSILNVGGNFTVASNATFTTTNITLNLDGSGTSISPQTITTGTQSFSNLTVSNSTYVTLSNSITVTGTITLTSGTLNDGGNTITANGSVLGSGTHTGSGLLLLTGGVSSYNLGSGTGTITLGNVQLNDNSNNAVLAGSTVITGTLTLGAGNVLLENYNLSLSGTPVGYSSSSFIQHWSTNTGTLTINNVGSGTVVFPVAISSNYVPLTFTGTTNAPNITVGFITNITNKPTINPVDTIGVQWSILASTASTANVTFQYPTGGSLVGSGFLSTGVVVAGVYSSGAYSETVLGSTSTVGSFYNNSTISALTLPTSSASLYVIGNQYTFAAGVPTPSITYLTGGNNQATLGFSAVSNGATVTSYTITPYIGGTAQTPITGISSSPYVVTGLTNGTAYRFTVSATNSSGTGTSAYSNYVTPATPTIYDSILANRTAIQFLNVTSSGVNSVTYNWTQNGGMLDSTFTQLSVSGSDSDLYYLQHLQYVLDMAEAYTLNTTYIIGGVNKSGYNNPIVKDSIISAFTWWLNRVPTYAAHNWHYATIDYPVTLSSLLVVMRGIGTNVDTTGFGTIEQTAISRCFANPETYNGAAPTASEIGVYCNGYQTPMQNLLNGTTYNGDNTTNICDYWLDWGCLTKQAWVVDTAISDLYTTMNFAETAVTSGLNPDYSFFQHYKQVYTQQYGGGWAHDLVAFANYLKGTTYAMSQTQLDTIYNYAHGSYYAAARGTYKDFSLNGREISIINNNIVDSTIAELGALVDGNSSHVTAYQLDKANCETSSPNYTGDTLHTHYFNADYTLHKRPNYNFSVRSVSTRTNMDESLNNQNLLGTFLAQGATCIMVHGNEYNNTFANWNWNYVPGVTMSDSLSGGVSVTQRNPNSGAYDTGYTKFVGGVSDGKYGASTLSLNYNQVTGNKSWFFFDSAVVCLGANIQSPKTGMNIVTSVNQAVINGPIYYNNTSGGSYSTFTPPTDANPATVTGTNIYSVFHDSIGYFFPTGNNVTIKQDSVYGNWTNVDSLFTSSTPDTTDMFLLSINHGTTPSNASYEYIVAPGISYSTMQSYNPLNAISILANTKYVQAVKHNGLNMMQVIFDSATSVTDPTSGITVKVNQPCALMLSNINQNPLTVTVSDPTQLLSNLTVTMSYSSNASQFNVINESLPSGYYVGSSVSFTVDSTAASATWVGTTSTSYNTASNWLANVAPTTGANITIASGAPNYPVLNTSSATTINNMTISGGSFTVNSTDTLKVDSSIINTGGTVNINGLVSYTGSSAQTIAANTFASNTVNNLLINNSAGVTLAGALNVSGTLYPTAGTLNSGGYLTLLSSSTGTARVDNVVGAISGNVNVQRYITAKTARKYSFIGSPVSASIRNSWQQQIYITGSGTGGNACGSTSGDGVASTDMYNSNGFDVTQTNNPSMFTYNATKINGSRYVSVANTDETNLSPGTGYILNIRGNRADGNCVNQLETASPTAPDAVTLNATGTLTTGDVTVSIYDTTLSKYTLLANPYPSQLSFSAFQTSNSTNVYNKMWTFSPFGSGNYTTYLNGVIANGATGYDNTVGNYIASGQAFFVEATQAGSAGTVTFHESHKTNGAIPNTQYFGSTENKLIRVGLSSTTDSSLLDEVVVRFDNDGSADFNPTIDAQSFSAASQTLVSLKGTNRLAIATHPSVTVADTTQLGVASTTNGTFRLLFSDYQGLDNTQTITLIDNFLGITQDVRANQSYDFNVTSNTASAGNNRFEIIVSDANALPVSFTSIAATKNTVGVAVNWSVVNQLKIANYEVERSTDGSNFASIATTKADNTSSYSIEDKNIPITANTLYYRIKSIGEDGSFKYSNVALLKLSTINYQLSIYPNPVQDKLNITLGTATYGTYKVRIITVAGVEAFSKSGVAANGNTISLDASNLASGVYMLELTDENGNKQLEKFVKN